MTKALHLALAVLTSVGVMLPAKADVFSPYTVNFNTAIDTSDHAFKVASNWQHIVDSYVTEDDYGNTDTYYVGYNYKATDGRDKSGAMYVQTQQLGSYYTSTYNAKDILVTPLVKGDITLYAKRYSYSYEGFVEFYSMNEDGTLGDLIKKFSSKSNSTGDPQLNQDDWAECTIHLDDYARVGLRCSYVYIDDFSATSADIEKEAALKITALTPTKTTGALYWTQQADGSVPVKFTVEVTNTGELDLTQGQPKYTVSLINTETKAVLAAPVAVPQDLDVGEVSAPFEANFIVPKDQVSTVFASSYSGTPMSVRENISGSKVDRANGYLVKYETKFVFRDRNTYTSSSRTSAASTGVIREATSMEFEIVNNNGGAPLRILSITVPDGFTTEEIPAEGVTLQKDEKLNVTVTSTAATPGVFSGNVEVKYIEIANGESTEKTYTLPVTSVVIAENTWLADFNNTSSTPAYPEGSIVENGIQSGYTYVSSNNYDNYLKSYTSSDYKTSNNKFITPKLHANAGDKISFDVRRNSDVNSDSFVKVYLSADRENWSEPVAAIVRDDTDGGWQTKTVTIPDAGDYYIGFAVYRLDIDNIVGLTKVEGITHDVYYRKDNLNEEYQSSTSIEPSVSVIPALALKEGEYTVNFYVDGEVKASLAGTDVAASAKNEKEFRLSIWKPEVTETTNFNTHFEFNFTDDTTIVLPTKQVKITYEPLFYFFDKGTNPGWYPANRTKAIEFGRVNTLGLTQSFEIYNHGSAPLTVSSISVPEGFTASVSEATVEPKQRQEVIITFSATETGSYSGDLKCVWNDAAGAAQEFTLAVSGELLDPSKWYATFDNENSNQVIWPAGSIYQSNVTATCPTYSAPYNFYLSSSSSSDNMFITPKLHARTGDKLSFDAAINSTGRKEGTVNVYAAATREGLAADETRTLLGKFSGKDVDDDHLLAVGLQPHSVTIPEAGDYYIGFELSGRGQLDEIYGLTLVDVAHDLLLDAPEMPATAMQNIAATATLSVRNIGLHEEAADSYSVIAYVNGVASATESVPALPLVNKLTADATRIPVTFRSPKAGTFPVYFELKAGDYTVATQPVDVTFAEEVLSGEKMVGQNDKTSEKFVNFYYKTASGVTIYTPEDLSLTGGDKITGIKFRGYMAGNNTKDFELWYKFTDDKDLAAPANGAYPTEGMTKLMSGNITFPKGESSSSNHVDLINVALDEPIVYPEGKSMVVMMYATAASYSRIYLETAASNGKSYYNSTDGNFATNGWYACEQPAMYLTLAVEATTLSGTVKNVDGTAAAGATVTLVSTDGDNVQYEATTAEDGTYTVNVIQSARTYNATASKGDLYDTVEDLAFSSDLIADFTLMPEVNITDDNADFAASELAHVNVALTFPAGVSTVVLPFSLTADEAREMFGDNVKVHTFTSDDGQSPAPSASFNLITDGMEAGVPHMIYLTEGVTTDFHATRKAVIAEPAKTEGTAVDFVGTFTAKALDENMVKIDGMNVSVAGENAIRALSDGDAAADTDNTVAPFHAYFQARPGHSINAVYFSSDSGLTTAIEAVSADSLDANTVIYDLRGIRVTNPSNGIFIVDGKKVYIK